MWLIFWLAGLLLVRTAESKLNWEYGQDYQDLEVVDQISGHIKPPENTKQIALQVPTCMDIEYVLVVIYNHINTPTVDFNKDTNTVKISYDQLSQKQRYKYDIIAKGRKSPQCSGLRWGYSYSFTGGVGSGRRGTSWGSHGGRGGQGWKGNGMGGGGRGRKGGGGGKGWACRGGRDYAGGASWICSGGDGSGTGGWSGVSSWVSDGWSGGNGGMASGGNWFGSGGGWSGGGGGWFGGNGGWVGGWW